MTFIPNEVRRWWLLFGSAFFLVMALLTSSGAYELTQLDYSRSTILPWLNLAMSFALYCLSAIFFRKARKLKQKGSPAGDLQ